MHILVKPESAWPLLENTLSFRHPTGMERTFRKTFLREWRKAKPGRTIEMVAAELHISRTQLGRIEKGQQPYNQEMLETLAELYGCSVADLLIRDPSDPDGIWSIWDQAKPGERRQITEVAKALVRTGTDG